VPAATWVLIVFLLAGGIVLLLRYALPGSLSSDGRADFIMAGLAGLYLLGLFSTPFVSATDWIVLDFVAIGVSLAAGAFGFLFGLPQHTARTDAASASPDDAGVRPSTNLETVADQLTKFITGAAFASIAVAAGYIDQFGRLVASALSLRQPTGVLLGDMLFLMYGSLGFVIAYIITRTVLGNVFEEADARLLHRGAEQLDVMLPDVGDDATPEQRALAASIVRVPFSTLTSVDQRLTWARAQTILGDYPKARIAYSSIYATAPDNPDVVIEFATALYNDRSFKDFEYVLALATTAKKLKEDDDELQARVAALIAAANLYIPTGYITSIQTTNDVLATRFAVPEVMRFYRACAFGQLYRAYRDAGKLPRPEGGAAPSDDELAISERITSDTKISFGFGENYRDKFRSVAMPPPEKSSDNDLQAFAADHPDFAVGVLKLKEPPPQPDPKEEWRPQYVPLPNGLTVAQFARNAPP
jgi:hypothetical protein